MIDIGLHKGKITRNQKQLLHYFAIEEFAVYLLTNALPTMTKKMKDLSFSYLSFEELTLLFVIYIII